MGLDLYIANKNYSSWSLRPWVLMRELGIDFTEHLTPFAAYGVGQNFRAFSPTGKVPCLVEDELVIWDSLAITEYLAERYPQVWPSSVAARAWARSACAEMHSGFTALRNLCTMNCGIRVRLSQPDASLDLDLRRIDELWNEGLTRFGGAYLAGSTFTAADAFYAPVAFRVQTYGLELSKPAANYAQRLLALESMQQWYAAALKETWREPAHEQEARQAGEWLDDLRS